MCGINGIFKFHDANGIKKGIKLMNSAISHRGPDSEGEFFFRNAGLGHRRLSIIDLNDNAKQPFVDNSGRYALVFNGEIYNYKQLKAYLSEYSFKTNSDSEVLLALYIKMGVACLNILEGMFAFAVYDTVKNEIFIARDRLGIKPLYYFINEEFIIFSSEIKAILASNFIERRVNKPALYDYIRYQTVHAPQTIVKGVNMLMPAHYCFISNHKFEAKKYWELAFDNSNLGKSYDQTKNDIKELFYSAVEKRLISDVPLGAFLSGGIDSSLVTGVMSDLSSSKINTFSVNFDESDFSEGKYARTVAKLFNTNHTEILLKPLDFLENLPEALKISDHPSGDGPNSYIVSKVTKNAGVSVALSGLGGDELFAGYDVFKKIFQLKKYDSLAATPVFVRKSIAKILTSLKNDIRTKKIAELLMLPDFDFKNIYPVFRLLFSDKEINNFFSADDYYANRVSEICTQIPLNPTHLLSAVSLAEINTYMQNVLLRDTDQMSMASALEVRVPFLDHKLVEYLYNVPDSFKYPHSPKKLLTESLNILPDEIINRPKMGFVLPWEHWLKNELSSFLDSRISSLAEREFFNTEAVISLKNKFLRGDKSVSWARLWIFIVLEDYLQKTELKF